MQHTVPYLISLSCGAELRAKISNVLDYSRVNARAGSYTPDALVAFADDQIARLDLPNGDPADGVWLGVGVIDPRINCYKAASEYRLSQSASAKVELVELYNHIKAVAATLPGYTPPVPEGFVAPKNGQSA